MQVLFSCSLWTHLEYKKYQIKLRMIAIKKHNSKKEKLKIRWLSTFENSQLDAQPNQSNLQYISYLTANPDASLKL